MRNHGNRLATILLIAKTADEGGGTVFPYLETTIQPEEGDIILWFNSDTRENREIDSVHGACPIKSGTKVALSLWIRQYPHQNIQSHTQSVYTSYQLDQVFRL
ncbi:hypothetical protein L596_013773 [Steinernema carpocapsae]|uniref:Prolyl 4-hydroxylase alpha subunit Fe(2+) 2OG dioxygenase domain-containing protein n=1 Tax=Steinernema carpocapsae TaxID=34508 RepID=A0A4U5P1Z5_STECR|nr:hypothetical protein L596_013773 [Steinernema carpocapsae]